MKKIWIGVLLTAMLVALLAMPVSAQEGAAVAAGDRVSLEAALTDPNGAVGNPQKYIQLTGTINGDVTVAGNVYLDLNGNDINGTVTITAGELYLFDSATSRYTAADYGKVTDIQEKGGKLVRTFVTPEALGIRQLRYVSIRHNETVEGAGGFTGFSAHRIYIGVSHSILIPAIEAVDYRTVYLMDEVLQKYVAAYGGIVTVNQVDSNTRVGGEHYLPVSSKMVPYSASSEESVRQNWRRIQVRNILGDNPEYNATQLASTCCAYVQFADGTEVRSSQVSKTFQQATRAAQQQAEAGLLTEKQNMLLTNMYLKHQDMFESWNTGSNAENYPIKCVCGAATSAEQLNTVTHKQGCDKVIYVWQPLTTAGITQSGNYYLTSSNTWGGTITFDASNAIRLDMNGHNIEELTQSYRVLQIWNQTEVWLTNTKSTGGRIAGMGWNKTTEHSGVLQIVHNGELNIVGDVTLQQVARPDVLLASAGAVSTGNGTINMYGGSIIGAGVGGEGAAVKVFSSGTFNMYGGTITGGTAGNMGGAIYNEGTLKIDGTNAPANAKPTVGGGKAVKGATIATKGKADIIEAVINGGVADRLNDDVTPRNSVGGYGAAFYVENGTLNVTNTTVNGGTIDYGHTADQGTNYGGTVLFACGGVTTFTGCQLNGGEDANIRRGGTFFTSGTAQVILDNSHATGSPVMVNGSVLYQESADASFVLRNGSSMTANSKNLVYGGAVSLLAGSFTMESGTITGTTVSHSAAGGAVMVNGGNFLMSGGTITGGKSTGGPGANVYLSTGSFTMNGGTITGGVSGTDSAKQHGGGVYVNTNTTFTMNGGSITGNTAKNCAGGVYVANGAVMRVSGGSITGNTAKDVNTNDIYVVNGDLYVTGGTLGTVNAINWESDGVNYGTNSADVILSGTPVIHRLLLNRGNKKIESTDGSGNTVVQTIEINFPVITLEAGKNLQQGADIRVDKDYGAFTTSDERFASCVQYIRGYEEGKDSIYDSQEKVLLFGVYHCLCGSSTHVFGCDGKKMSWTEFPYDLVTGGSENVTIPAGNYYLTKDLTTGGQLYVAGTAQKTCVVNIDLNGWNISASQNRAMHIDSNAAVVITHTNANGTYGNAQNGTVRGTNINDKGGALRVDGSLKLMNTKVTGSTATEGGAIYNAGTLEIHGGSVTGGTASFGAAIATVGMATVNDATISGGTMDRDINAHSGGKGGAFYAAGGQLTINRCTIHNGVVDQLDSQDTDNYGGGAIYARAGVVTVNDSTLNGNVSNGNIRRGGALFVSGNATVKLHNTVATANKVAVNAGVLWIEGGTVEMTGTTHLNASNVAKYTYGCAVTVINGTFIMKSGTITGSTASYAPLGGGAVYIGGGKMDMSGGLITGGTAPNNRGGGLYLNQNGKLKLSGTAQIKNNSGNNLFLTTGATMEVGTFSSGADITMSMEAGGGYITSNASASNAAAAQYIRDEKQGFPVEFISDSGHSKYQHLSLGKVHCQCGLNSQGKHFGECDVVDHYWYPWDAKTLNVMPNQPGYWYIRESCTVNNNTVLETGDVYIDLNGKTVTVPGNWRAFVIGSYTQNAPVPDSLDLTIMDSGKGGTITKGTSAHTTANQGILMWSVFIAPIHKATFNMYGGHLNAGNITSNTYGAIFLESSNAARINIFGGTVTGCKQATKGNAFYLTKATVLSVSGDAKILGGHATGWGGVISTEQGTKLKVADNASITGGTSDDPTAADVQIIDAVMEMSGGHVGVMNLHSDSAKAVLRVSGTAKVDLFTRSTAGKFPQPRIHINAPMKTGASIKMKGITGSFSEITVRGNRHYFTCLDGYHVGFEDGTSTLNAGGATVTHCICGAATNDTQIVKHNPDCNQVIYSWVPFNEQNAAYGGNYYLTGNVTRPEGSPLVLSGVVRLDLNGWNITGTAGSVIKTIESADLYLCNTDSNLYYGDKDGGVIATTGGTTNQVYGTVHHDGGLLTVMDGVTLKNTVSGDKGSALYVGGTAEILGGKLIGSAINGNGGAVVVTGTLNLRSGQIVGAAATNGGAIYNNGGTVNLLGGTVTGGNASSRGGGVYQESGRLNIGDAVIQGGSAAQGGGVYIAGGSISLSGNAQITGNTGGNLYLPFGKTLTASNLSYKAQIGISMEAADAFTAGKVSASVASRFSSDDSNYKVAHDSSGIVRLMTSSTAYHCVCGASKTGGAHNEGCDQVLYYWTAYPYDSLNYNDAIIPSGNYYLTKNLVRSGKQLVVKGNSATDVSTVRIDLNGWNITTTSHRTFGIRNFATLTLTNTNCNPNYGSASGGQITGQGSSSSFTVMQMYDPNNADSMEVNIFPNITIKGTNTSVLSSGVTIYAAAGRVNIYGATLYGSKTAGTGGALYITSTATVKLVGATVHGAATSLNAGAIYNAGELYMKNTTVYGGTATEKAGAIYNVKNLTMVNSTVSGGSANQFNCMYNTGTMHISGKTVIGDVTTMNQIVLDDALASGSSVNVSIGISEGRVTAGNAATAATATYFKVNGNTGVVAHELGYLYLPGKSSGNVLLVGYGETSLDPTDEQLEFARAGYLDVNRRSPLPIQGFGTYAPGWTIGQSATTSAAAKEYDKLRATAIAFSDSEGDVVIVISADSTAAGAAVLRDIRNEISVRFGVPADNILISCTHAHSTPLLTNSKVFYVGDKSSANSKNGNFVYETDANGNVIYDTDASGNSVPRKIVAGELKETYYTTFFNAVVEAARLALEDRKPVTGVSKAVADDVNRVYDGRTYSQVRNYKAYIRYSNGAPVMSYGKEGFIGMNAPNHIDFVTPTLSSGQSLKYEPETETDGSLQLVRYERQGGSPIIITNFQTHPHRNSSGSDTDITADVVGTYRYALEKLYNDGTQVVYFSGAGGNINPHGGNGCNESTSYSKADYVKWGEGLAAIAKSLKYVPIQDFSTQVEAVAMKATYNMMAEFDANGYTAYERYLKAKDVMASGIIGPNIAQSYKDTYKIYSSYHADRMIKRYENVNLTMEKNGGVPVTAQLPIAAFRVGNIGYVVAPYEMFDTNGVQIKEASPYDITIITTMSNGCEGYIPNIEGFINGGYSTDVSPFDVGTGELMVEYYLQMLESMKDK